MKILEALNDFKKELYLHGSSIAIVCRNIFPSPRKYKETIFNIVKDNPGKLIMSKESMDMFYYGKEYEWIVSD